MTLAEYEKDPNHIANNFIKYYYSKLSSDSSKLYQLYSPDAVLKHMDKNTDPFENKSIDLNVPEKIKKYWKSVPGISGAKLIILTVNTIKNLDNTLVTTVVGELLLKEDYENEDVISPTRLFTQTFILQPHPKKDTFDIKSDILTFIPDSDYMNIELNDDSVSSNNDIIENAQSVEKSNNDDHSNEGNQQVVVEKSLSPSTAKINDESISNQTNNTSNGSPTDSKNKKIVKNSTSLNSVAIATSKSPVDVPVKATTQNASIQKKQTSPTSQSSNSNSSSSPVTATTITETTLSSQTAESSLKVSAKSNSETKNETLKTSEKSVDNKTNQKPVAKSTQNPNTSSTTSISTKTSSTSNTNSKQSTISSTATSSSTTSTVTTPSSHSHSPSPSSTPSSSTTQIPSASSAQAQTQTQTAKPKSLASSEPHEIKQSPVVPTSGGFSWASQLKLAKDTSPAQQQQQQQQVASSTSTKNSNNKSNENKSNDNKSNDSKSNDNKSHEVYVDFKNASSFVDESVLKLAFSEKKFRNFTVSLNKNDTAIVGFSSGDDQNKALSMGKITYNNIDFMIEKREKKAKNKKSYKHSNNNNNGNGKRN